MLGRRKALSLRLFHETIYFSAHKRTTSTPLRPVVQGNEEAPPTIVTSYVRDCFGHMVIGKILKVIGNTTTPGLGAQSRQPLNGTVKEARECPDGFLSDK